MIQPFIDLVKYNLRQGMVVCEVGCWVGESSVNWLPIVKGAGGKGVLVDHFIGNLNVSGGPHAYDPNSQAFKTLIEGLTTHNIMDTAIVLHGKSELMADYIPNESLDLVFIDANHGYSSVSKDIQMYTKKVRPGGIISGHDLDEWLNREYSPEEYEMDTHNGHHIGVARAVEEAFGRDRVNCPGNTVWWVRK